MITDEALRVAAARSCELYVAHLEKGFDPEIKHEFSVAFLKKIYRLTRKANHPVLYKTMHRVASIVLAILITGGVWITIDAETRAAVVGWLKETYEMFFVYRYSGEADVSTESNDYRPEQLPNGYSEYMTIDENGGVTILYKHESGTRMKFGYIHNPSSNLWYVDTTDTIQSESFVGGHPANLFTSTNKDVASIIMWTDDKENVAFYVSGFFDETELIAIAESVSIIK